MSLKLLNPACVNSQMTLPPKLSPSCARHYISKNVYRYDLYKLKVIPSPVISSTPKVSLPSPVSTRKSASPQVKIVHTPKIRRVTAQPIPETVASEAPPAPRYAAVNFKFETVFYLAPFRVAIGDRVVVEGDRGTHFGTVASITTEPPRQETVRRVLRRATASDVEAFHLQKEHEIEAVSVARAIAQECRMNKEAAIVDAEFQFDGQKLTIFVERSSTSVFVDFRKLQRGLYKEYHCRIWCAYVDELSRNDNR